MGGRTEIRRRCVSALVISTAMAVSLGGCGRHVPPRTAPRVSTMTQHPPAVRNGWTPTFTPRERREALSDPKQPAFRDDVTGSVSLSGDALDARGSGAVGTSSDPTSTGLTSVPKRRAPAEISNSAPDPVRERQSPDGRYYAQPRCSPRSHLALRTCSRVAFTQCLKSPTLGKPLNRLHLVASDAPADTTSSTAPSKRLRRARSAGPL